MQNNNCWRTLRNDDDAEHQEYDIHVRYTSITVLQADQKDSA